MKKAIAFALLGVCLAGVAMADRVGTANVELRNGYYFNSTTGEKTDADGNAYTIEAYRDRDIDFGVVNMIASVAIDSGGTGGANFRTSAAVDVRKWTTGNLIIHITAAAAGDTVGTYDYGVSLFPLTQAAIDWTSIGVPIPSNPGAFASGLANGSFAILPGSQADSSGIWRNNPNQQNTFQGERRIRLQTQRNGDSNYHNINAGQTVSLPFSYWLGAQRPRYICVQVRLMAKAIAGNLTPTVRVDVEGLR